VTQFVDSFGSIILGPDIVCEVRAVEESCAPRVHAISLSEKQWCN